MIDINNLFPICRNWQGYTSEGNFHVREFRLSAALPCAMGKSLVELLANKAAGVKYFG